MKRRGTLSARLGAIGGMLLLIALTSIGLTLWIAWQLEGGAAAVNEAGRMRMQTWRLAQTVGVADEARVALLVAHFDRSLLILRNGDPSRPLFVPDDPRSRQALDAVERDWKVLREAWSGASTTSSVDAAAQAGAFVEQIDAFVTAIESQLARLTRFLNVFQLAMVVLVIASAFALLYSAQRFVFEPLAQLQAGLARIGQGALDTRITSASTAEFAELSDGFNRMASTLSELYRTLEDKVREKTLRLEQEHGRLASLYQAAAFVARAGTLGELAEGFARQVRQVANADGCVVRWSDEANKRYLMLASDGLPEDFLRDERCLPTGECVCGQTRSQARFRVIPVVSEEPGDPGRMLEHCRRGGFATVVGVPVRLQERLVGELNLFYRTPVELGEDDRSLLETLSSHLAGAVESLRAAALEREKAISEERGLLARELHDSIAQSLSFLKIQVGLLRKAIDRDDPSGIGKTLAELDTGVQDSLSDVRELLMHFRTRTNTEDITPALQTTLRKFEHQTGLETHLSVEGEGLPLAPDVQIQVLHVVQEALSNIRKHANARQVWIEVQQSPPWRVEVRDDGCGFDQTSGAPDETHIGMKIMRERARSIGASVEVATVQGEGTCVVLTLPEHERQAA